MVTRFVVTPSADAPLFPGSYSPEVAISPDGTRIVYGTGLLPSAASRQLYLRQLDQLEAVPLRGTERGVKGGTKLDQMAEENQTTWPLGRVSENGCAAGLERRQGPPVGGPWRSGSRAAQPATCEGRRQDGGAAASWRTCLLCARR